MRFNPTTCIQSGPHFTLDQCIYKHAVASIDLNILSTNNQQAAIFRLSISKQVHITGLRDSYILYQIGQAYCLTGTRILSESHRGHIQA